jgi:hypothetical protein
VTLAGGVGERLYCGGDGHQGTTADVQTFLAAVKDSRAWGWGLPTARAAFTSIVERILLGNEHLIYHVAKQLHQRRYLPADEVCALVAYGKRFYGFRHSPLLRPDWRVVLDDELALQRRVEQIIAQEVARNQALEASRQRSG